MPCAARDSRSTCIGKLAMRLARRSRSTPLGGPSLSKEKYREALSYCSDALEPCIKLDYKIGEGFDQGQPRLRARCRRSERS